MDRADLLRHEVELFDCDRRNENTIVGLDGEPVWFVKRPKAGTASHLVRHECEVLGALAGVPGLSIPRLAPAGTADMCVTAYEEGTETAAARVQRLGRLSRSIARGIGSSLARIHEVSGTELPDVAAFHPWALSLDAPLAEILAEASQGTLSFLRHVQTPALVTSLERLRRAWMPVAITHNDVKFDNILVRIKPPHRLVLTDWETASCGDPAWDVGSVLAELLNVWLSSMTASDEMSIAEIQGSATRPLADILPTVGAFLAAYRRARAVDAEFVIRSVACSGARLIQFGYEAMQERTALTTHTALQMQVAVNILTRPEDAAVRLLEIGA